MGEGAAQSQSQDKPKALTEKSAKSPEKKTPAKVHRASVTKPSTTRVSVTAALGAMKVRSKSVESSSSSYSRITDKSFRSVTPGAPLLNIAEEMSPSASDRELPNMSLLQRNDSLSMSSVSPLG